MKQAILTIFGKDRPGIIATVTGILFKHGCNLEDVSMTILEGEFAMMTVLSFHQAKAAAIQRELNRLTGSWQLSFFWKDCKAPLRRGEKHGRGCESYLLTAIGKDRTGIVYKTSRLLADFGLNITDLNSKILGQGRQAVYTMILEIDIPKKFRLEKLKRALKVLSRKLRIELQLKPVERIEL